MKPITTRFAVGVSVVGLALSGTAVSASALTAKPSEAPVIAAACSRPTTHLEKATENGSYSLDLCTTANTWRWSGWIQHDNSSGGCTTFKVRKPDGSYNRTWQACEMEFTSVDSGLQQGSYSPAQHTISIG
ncbi:hypothetical protein ACIQNU_11945 [Streptomyces sp. NPDC091292]|uniref:hypothetical protein n=1 Tax=Streptomyces sp. NPDC091292 TaxID=3365991 RepID=UPI0038105350